MITVDIIMDTDPCAAYPRTKVARLLSRPGVDTSSWVRLAESCRDLGWPVPLRDLRLTAYRHASPTARIAGCRRSTIVRIGYDRDRFTDAADHTLGVWGELIRWASGDDDVDLVEIRSAAYAAAYAYAAAAAYAYAAAADGAYAAATTADGAYAADTYAAAYAAAGADGGADGGAGGADAAAEEEWSGLLYICELIDAEESK